MTAQEDRQQAVPKRGHGHIAGAPNVIFDLLAVSHNTLEAIEALEQYKRDAQDAGDTDLLELFDNIQQLQLQAEERINEYLRNVAPITTLRGHGH
jgi:hypothetical protein